MQTLLAVGKHWNVYCPTKSSKLDLALATNIQQVRQRIFISLSVKTSTNIVFTVNYIKLTLMFSGFMYWNVSGTANQRLKNSFKSHLTIRKCKRKVCWLVVKQFNSCWLVVKQFHSWMSCGAASRQPPRASEGLWNSLSFVTKWNQLLNNANFPNITSDQMCCWFSPLQ